MKKEIVNFLEVSGIYESTKIALDKQDMRDLLTSSFSLDVYCPNCKQDSIYMRKYQFDFGGYSQSYYTNTDWLIEQINVHMFQFQCTRDLKSMLSIFLRCTETTIMKVGQYPSPIDMSIKISSKYADILGVKLQDYRSAIELHTHGYFAGAYAYLRRVVEFQIGNAYELANLSGTFDNDQYNRSRTQEKIKMLR
jgi:hypothetical protein